MKQTPPESEMQKFVISSLQMKQLSAFKFFWLYSAGFKNLVREAKHA